MQETFEKNLTFLYRVVLKILEETHLIFTGSTFLFALYTLSPGVVFFSLGGIACTYLCKALKKVIKQPRPDGDGLMLKKRKGHGMPSTHSATITHYAVYISLASHYLPIHSSLPQSHLTRDIPPFIIIPWAVAVIQSRVWLGHHTWAQCAVGCLVGAIFSMIWFSLWTHWVNRIAFSIDSAIRSIVSRAFAL